MLPFRNHGFRTVPYGMFRIEDYGLQAKNARVLERIYHKGHQLAWDGKEVLQSLIEQHGKPSLAPREKEALGRVFSIIMWGELAAWRISAELADELEPLEAKLAATSQAFDEARHFYVMHDYLEALDALPKKMDRGAQSLLEAVMNADHLAKKLLGMQLMIEPIALTLFHVVKKFDLEPVLSHLLPYYERDEARHVALGVQYLPAMLSQMSASERLGLWAFQFRLITYEIWSNYGLSRDLLALGVEPRSLLELGQGKQMKALEMLFEKSVVTSDIPMNILSRYADALSELTLPTLGKPRTLRDRLEAAVRVSVYGSHVQSVELTPDVTAEQTPLIRHQEDAVA